MATGIAVQGEGGSMTWDALIAVLGYGKRCERCEPPGAYAPRVVQVLPS
jgi:hypothetical protein